ESEIVLDDSIVDNDDLTCAIAMRMSVLLGRPSVSGPAGVADAVDAFERAHANGVLEIAQLPGCAPDVEGAIVADNGDTRRIVPAVLETFESVEDNRHRFARA